MPIKTKSVHSPIDRKKDGLRILAARYRGRGMPASRYDVWMASLGPSEKLLKDFLGQKISHARFRTLYRQEMLGSDETDAKNPTIGNRGQKYTLRLLQQLARERDITIMCHCAEDATNCHRFLLQELIRKA
jgi:uncharacterized protein YeaO (DUF488 family)